MSLITHFTEDILLTLCTYINYFLAYFQLGDNLFRKEPTSGALKYNNIFKHIHKKEHQGILGMEHGNSMKGKHGELAVIAVYRIVDNFL